MLQIFNATIYAEFLPIRCHETTLLHFIIKKQKNRKVSYFLKPSKRLVTYSIQWNKMYCTTTGCLLCESSISMQHRIFVFIASLTVDKVRSKDRFWGL